MAQAAVEKKGLCLRFVPKRMRHNPNPNPNSGHKLNCNRNHKLNRNCNLDPNPNPNPDRTYRLCLTAIRNNDLAFSLVPKSKLDKATYYMFYFK